MPEQRNYLMVSELLGKRSLQLARHIVPLFKSDERKRVVLEGTGFLVSSDSGHFLVSAAHVLEQCRDEELFFYVDKWKKARLSGNGLLAPLPANGNREDDKVDVGVIRLSSELSPPFYEVDKISVSITRLLARQTPREDKKYLLVGIPETKSRANPTKKQIESQVLSYCGISCPRETYSLEGYEEEHHILVSYDRKRTVDASGRIQRSPDLRGMSGSPLWLLYDENIAENPLEEPIVGVFIERARVSGAIVCSDIRPALEMIQSLEVKAQIIGV